MIAPAGAGDVGPAQGLQRGLHRRHHPASETGVVSDQDRLSDRVMLSLGKQVNGDPVRIVPGVGNHQDFRRAGDRINADLTEDQPLRRRHIGVAGADDLVHRSYRLGPISQRGDGLGAADPVNFPHPGKLRRRKNQGIENAIGGRDRHHPAFHPGDTRRDGVHQNRAWIGRHSAGNIKADRIDRTPSQSQADAVLVFIGKVAGHLRPVERLDAFCRQRQGVEGFRIALLPRLGNLLGADPKGRGRQSQSVEFGRQLDQRRVAALADILDYRRRDVANIGFAFTLAVEQGLKTALEIRCGAIQLKRQGPPPGTGRPTC